MKSLNEKSYKIANKLYPLFRFYSTVALCGACNTGIRRLEKYKVGVLEREIATTQCAATRTLSKHDAPRNRFLHPAQPPFRAVLSALPLQACIIRRTAESATHPRARSGFCCGEKCVLTI